MTSALPALNLLCHPATPCPLALQVSATLHWQASGMLLRYRVSGQVADIQLPPAATPGAADGLWQHTCMEAFVSPVWAAHYREFNFSPSGQWAAYCFSAERQRDTDTEARRPIQPTLRMEHTSEQFDLWAELPATALPPASSLCLGLSAVIETRDGHRSYWALQHPRPDRPDFHHRGGWREMPSVAPNPPTATA
ncbi:DOMON-like domain-containing protein [Hydrogenophaga atypica]|uniref:DOMON-like domain-containing protein n=1 Tax=Hydrogenophaga atypica TaxID=249409 RepID=A0ABW2QL58_9BURK